MTDEKGGKKRTKAAAKEAFRPKAPRGGKVTVSEKEYAELEEKARTAAETQDRLLRLGAEFDNFKKRMERERVEFLKYANAGSVLELIKVIDHFERAVEAAEKSKDFDSLLQGVKMIQAEIEGTLRKKGLERIKVVGELFDPHRHEAVAEVLTDEYPEHTVVEELQKGYLLEGKVIRPAAVKVAKKPEDRSQMSEDRGQKAEEQ